MAVKALVLTCTRAGVTLPHFKALGVHCISPPGLLGGSSKKSSEHPVRIAAFPFYKAFPGDTGLGEGTHTRYPLSARQGLLSGCSNARLCAGDTVFTGTA